MSLKIYNTLTRKKEEFKATQAGKIKMYVCGITAYDECHLGHARAAIVFDVIYRTLKFRYPNDEITYIRNFTDVDDKIIKKSKETGTPWQEITEKYIRSYQEQMTRLNVLSPTQEPRATQHIDEMKSLIQSLISKGLAYPAGNDVYFEVRQFKGYGKLSNKKIDELESGARIEVDEKKKDPLDFALWKGAKPGEPQWPSPWGAGRPGWHIECSAMSTKYLGDSFDIHGGGRDLMFPHHENEIAQSEGASGKQPFSRYWIHNGFVNINAEKMSKSLGNFLTIPNILTHWEPEVVRYFLLSSHYASPLDFTEQAMANAQEALIRFYEALLRLKESQTGSSHYSVDFDRCLIEGLDDDFNTTVVVGRLFEMVRHINKMLDAKQWITAADKEAFFQGIKKINEVLGIFGCEPTAFLNKIRQKGLALSSEEITSLIAERKTARLTKDWKRSDEIRDELLSKGILLKDNPDGSTTWETQR
ncbi:MAG: cysteine--tRNA ligase [Deltaproteobacteria bacterium]|nr:cysteine--tRNA ligase [Deltaproteobacteria bacterium]